MNNTRSTQPKTKRPARLGIALVALAIDAALIVLFAAIGRGEHARAATLGGLFETAWPFLAGLAITWVVALVWRHPLSIVRAGIPVWIGTVTLGMIFRLLSGQGTALPFIFVATGTLALFLVCWRGVPAIASWLRSRRSASSALNG